MASRTVLLAALVTLAFSGPSPAGAALVTVEFQGFVGVLEDGFGLVPDGVTTFTGAYFYDDQTAVQNPCPVFPRCQEYTFGPEAGVVLDIGGVQFSYLNRDLPDIPLTIRLRSDGESGTYSVGWVRTVDQPLSPDSTTRLTEDAFQIDVPPSGGPLPGSGFLTTTDLVVPDFSLASSASIHITFRHELTPATFDPNRVPPFIPSIVRRSLVNGGAILTEVPEPAAVILLLSVGALWLATRSRLAP